MTDAAQELSPDWLTEVAAADFQRNHFQQQPLARPYAARSAIGLLTWETVEDLVSLYPPPDMITVRNGQLIEDVRPRSFREVRASLDAGVSLVIRGCEEHSEPLRSVACAFGRRLQGHVSVQVYVTPAGYHSFGWHYDCEDVFIAQTRGVKDYYLRKNTVNPRPTIDAMPRDMQYERESSPVMAASTLIAGDWLYIPRGWWHVARGREEDSLSISVGVLSPDARGNSLHLPNPLAQPLPSARMR